ncbi:glycosyltransferase, partial [Vibrio splendidus]
MSELHISRPKISTSQINPAVSLSIIVPFYDEQEVLEEFHSRLTKVLDSLPIKSEIVYVDDGSKDSSLELVSSFTSINSSISVIGLSRNFGKESAMSAGLEH